LFFKKLYNDKDLLIVKQLSVSFIIPAYNEELFLPQVLESIKHYMPAELSYEVIVADNGSKDKTVEIAQNQGAETFIDEKVTVGGLRNLAVKRSKGTVLVFVDADVSITRSWGRNIYDVYQSIIKNPNKITGSRCGIPVDASWIEEIWFRPLIAKPGKYINSGHLITSRKLFDLIGGFNEKIETGEDYAFGQLAKRVNADIINNPSLAVVHKGYPKTIYQFMRREMWHGRGDCVSFRRLLASKVAMASIVFMFLHFLAVTGLILGQDFISILSVLLIFFMCASASIFKHETRTIKDLVVTSFLYYLYFVSRFLSCLSFLSARTVNRTEGN